MTALHPALRALIDSGPPAHLTTLNRDGSPQVSVIWIGVDGDDIVSAHMGVYLKLRNLRRDPRYVLSFDAPRVPGMPMSEHAVVRGTATIEEGGASALLARLAPAYLLDGERLPEPDGRPGYILRYRVERVSGVGPWVTPRKG